MKLKLPIFQILCTAIVAAVFISWFRSEHREKPEAPSPETKAHVHEWNKWTDPAKSSDWYNGTWFTQARTCATCGEAQIREVKISAHAGK